MTRKVYAVHPDPAQAPIGQYWGSDAGNPVLGSPPADTGTRFWPLSQQVKVFKGTNVDFQFDIFDADVIEYEQNKYALLDPNRYITAAYTITLTCSDSSLHWEGENSSVCDFTFDEVMFSGQKSLEIPINWNQVPFQVTIDVVDNSTLTGLQGATGSIKDPKLQHVWDFIPGTEYPSALAFSRANPPQYTPNKPIAKSSPHDALVVRLGMPAISGQQRPHYEGVAMQETFNWSLVNVSFPADVNPNLMSSHNFQTITEFEEHVLSGNTMKASFTFNSSDEITDQYAQGTRILSEAMFDPSAFNKQNGIGWQVDQYFLCGPGSPTPQVQHTIIKHHRIGNTYYFRFDK